MREVRRPGPLSSGVFVIPGPSATRPSVTFLINSVRNSGKTPREPHLLDFLVRFRPFSLIPSFLTFWRFWRKDPRKQWCSGRLLTLFSVTFVTFWDKSGRNSTLFRSDSPKSDKSDEMARFLTFFPESDKSAILRKTAESDKSGSPGRVPRCLLRHFLTPGGSESVFYPLTFSEK